MIISWILTYLVLSILAILWSTLYSVHETSRFSKEHNIDWGVYYKFVIEHCYDVLPINKPFIRICKGLAFPVTQPLVMVKALNDLGKMYANMTKQTTFNQG